MMFTSTSPWTALPLFFALLVPVATIAQSSEGSPHVASSAPVPEGLPGIAEPSGPTADRALELVEMTLTPENDGTGNTDESISDGSAALPVEEGGTGVLELSFAAGASPFGVARITLVFEPDALEVVDVAPSDDLPSGLMLEHVLLPGELRAVAVNTSSLDEPVGTFKLMRITVRPLAEAGTVIAVSAEQNAAFNTELVAYRNRISGHADVIVTAPATTSTTSRR